MADNYFILLLTNTFFYVNHQVMPSAHHLRRNCPSPGIPLEARWICVVLVLVAGAAGIFSGAHAHGNRRAVELLAGFTAVPLAFAYVAFDLLLVFADRSIRADLVALNTNYMYTTLPHLQSAIRLSLQKGQLCRVYKESLDACWPHLSDDDQAERIARFAAQHHWVVSFRQLGALGLVAEFEKADSGAHVAHG